MVPYKSKDKDRAVPIDSVPRNGWLECRMRVECRGCDSYVLFDPTETPNIYGYHWFCRFANRLLTPNECCFKARYINTWGDKWTAS
jgi:hypothetical protein